MTNQGERLQSLIKQLKTNQLRFSNYIGVQVSQTNAICKDRAEFSSGYLKRVAIKYPLVNSHWLLTGVGEMFTPKEADTVEEPDFFYKKSMNLVPPIIYKEDGLLRKTMGENFKVLAERWGMKKNEMFGIIMPGVQKQSVTNYLNGTSQPPIWVLIYLEQITGIAIAAWFTKSIKLEEMPIGPVDAAAVGIGESLRAEIKSGLLELLDKIG